MQTLCTNVTSQKITTNPITLIVPNASDYGHAALFRMPKPSLARFDYTLASGTLCELSQPCIQNKCAEACSLWHPSPQV